jgi:hypothetical protein
LPSVIFCCPFRTGAQPLSTPAGNWQNRQAKTDRANNSMVMIKHREKTEPRQGLQRHGAGRAKGCPGLLE